MSWKPYNGLTPRPAIATATRKAAFDIETIGWTEPYAVGFYNGKEFKLFEGRDCIKTFLEFFLTKKQRHLITYAHNGGKFDFSFLLQELVQNKKYEHWNIRPVRIGARITEIRVQHGKQHWILRDSVAFLPFSLKKVTHNFGVRS